MAKTDERTLQLIQEVAKQKKEISKAENPKWITNCSFKAFEGAQSVNLHVVSDLATLISIGARLREKERLYAETAAHLGLTEFPPFTWDGYKVEEWISDIKSRINKVQISLKKKKLEELESRLNAIVSPDLRAQLELEAISAELK